MEYRAFLVSVLQNWWSVSERQTGTAELLGAWEGCLFGGSCSSPSIRVMHEI